MKIRGLKTSTDFLLFLFHEGHKILHEKERATHPAFLRADTIRLSADSLIASADSIRKPADTIRKMTDGTRATDDRKRLFSSEKSRKNGLSSIFGGFSLSDFLRKSLFSTKKAVQKFSFIKCVC